MADVHEPEVRSYNMSQIKSKDTKPEILVRKFLHTNGFRFRIHDKKLPGKPDIVLKKYKTIIFIHGCFWHGHNCPLGKLPETRKSFWKEKIYGNINRDINNQKELENLGFKVITIWQCDLKNKKVRENTLLDLLKTLKDRKK